MSRSPACGEFARPSAPERVLYWLLTPAAPVEFRFTEGTSAMRWEYHTEVLKTQNWFLGGGINQEDLDRRLARLGSEHWELVSTSITTLTYGATRYLLLYFKRPLER